jgi:hypothetical protein
VPALLPEIEICEEDCSAVMVSSLKAQFRYTQ